MLMLHFRVFQQDAGRWHAGHLVQISNSDLDRFLTQTKQASEDAKFDVPQLEKPDSLRLPDPTQEFNSCVSVTSNMDDRNVWVQSVLSLSSDLVLEDKEPAEKSKFWCSSASANDAQTCSVFRSDTFSNFCKKGALTSGTSTWNSSPCSDQRKRLSPLLDEILGSAPVGNDFVDGKNSMNRLDISQELQTIAKNSETQPKEISLVADGSDTDTLGEELASLGNLSDTLTSLENLSSSLDPNDFHSSECLQRALDVKNLWVAENQGRRRKRSFCSGI